MSEVGDGPTDDTSRETIRRSSEPAGGSKAGDEDRSTVMGHVGPRDDPLATADRPFAEPSTAPRATVIGRVATGAHGGAPVALPENLVRLPVHRPQRRRRLLALAAASVVATATVLGWLFLRSGPKARPAPAPVPLAVVGVSVGLAPSGSLHCPQGVATYTAIVTTNGGAGDISYFWVRPDGSAAPVATATVGAGQSTVTASLSFTFSGNGKAGGTAEFDVVQPATSRAFAPPVSYLCP